MTVYRTRVLAEVAAQATFQGTPIALVDRTRAQVGLPGVQSSPPTAQLTVTNTNTFPVNLTMVVTPWFSSNGVSFSALTGAVKSGGSVWTASAFIPQNSATVQTVQLYIPAVPGQYVFVVRLSGDQIDPVTGAIVRSFTIARNYIGSTGINILFPPTVKTGLPLAATDISDIVHGFNYGPLYQGPLFPSFDGWLLSPYSIQVSGVFTNYYLPPSPLGTAATWYGPGYPLTSGHIGWLFSDGVNAWVLAYDPVTQTVSDYYGISVGNMNLVIKYPTPVV